LVEEFANGGLAKLGIIESVDRKDGGLVTFSIERYDEIEEWRLS
jgi:hypothetical protein